MMDWAGYFEEREKEVGDEEEKEEEEQNWLDR